MSDEEKQKAPKRGVGTVAIEAIRAGKTNEEALEAVQAEFPDARTSLASINWYRNKLRSDGEKVPTARELKKAAGGDEGKKAKKDKKAAADKDPLE